MKACVVPKCPSWRGRPGVFFHSFPTNFERRVMWIKAVRAVLPNQNGTSNPWFPSEFAKICSKHFKPEDYNQETKVHRLLPHAVPSQFQQSILQTQNRRFRQRRCQQPGEGARSPSVLGAVPNGHAEPVSSSRQRSSGHVAMPTVKIKTPPMVIQPLMDSSSVCDGEAQQSTGGKAGPPVEARTSLVVLQPPRNSSSGLDCEGQQSTGGEARPPVRATTPVGMTQYSGDSIIGLDWEGPTPIVPAEEAVPVCVVASVACQTDVSELMMAAYEEEVKFLQKECKRLREELRELRILNLGAEM